MRNPQRNGFATKRLAQMAIDAVDAWMLLYGGQSTIDKVRRAKRHKKEAEEALEYFKNHPVEE